MTLFLLLRHFPCAAAGGIGYPVFTTSRSRLVFKYTSICLSPKAMNLSLASKIMGYQSATPSPIVRSRFTTQHVRTTEARGSTTILIPRTRTRRLQDRSRTYFSAASTFANTLMWSLSPICLRVLTYTKTVIGPSSALRRLRLSRSYLVRCANIAFSDVLVWGLPLLGNWPCERGGATCTSKRSQWR